MADLLYWVWLHTRLTPGTEAYAKLRTSFPAPRDVYEADAEALRRVLGDKSMATVRALMDKSTADAERILDYVASKRIGILTYDDPRFPERLRRIAAPPVLLYYAGHLPDLEGCFAVAVVGSRDYAPYGARMTFEIAHDLALGGATVVSGLAYGVDSIAAAAAMAGGGATIAVLGSGIDVIYPKEHIKLARAIARKGVVMTEYPPGTKPFGPHFPQRNRIIAALSHVVLVTSASLHSGALITARCASEQGKALYALPGNVDDPLCEGTALLLREGAKAAVCAEDILMANEKEFPGVVNLFRLLEHPMAPMDKTLRAVGVACRGQKKRGASAATSYVSSPPADVMLTGERVAEYLPTLPDERLLDGLDAVSRAVYDRIPEGGDCAVDALTVEGASHASITVALTKLEIKHLIQILPGGRLSRAPLAKRKD